MFHYESFTSWLRPVWWLALAAAFFYLLEFLLQPLLGVVATAFRYPGDAPFSLRYLALLFQHPILRESILNSTLVAIGAALLATLAALPFAIHIVRRQIRGAAWVEALGILPLFVPPFLAATSLRLMFGDSGMLDQLFGMSVLELEGLFGLTLIQALHYFPLLLLLATWAMRSIDPALLEAARSGGTREWRIHLRITLPVCAPVLLAGVVLVFSRVIDDLGTPLMMGIKTMIAPLIYLRVTSVGIDDPVSAALSLLQLLIALPAWWLALRVLYRHGADEARLPLVWSRQPARLSPPGAGEASHLSVILIALVLCVSLLPHLLLLLLSFSDVWSYSYLPESYTLNNYSKAFQAFTPFLNNTLLYCGLASLIGSAVGGLLAYLLNRSRSALRGWYRYAAYSLFAIPGSVLATGYLTRFMEFSLPGVEIELSTTGLLVAIAYSIRSLPFSIWIFLYALQRIPPDLELAAMGQGASPGRTMRRVLLPLLAGPFLLAVITSFVISAMDLSLSMLLVPNESLSRVSHGIYLYLHTATQRGMGAAMSMLLLAFLTLCVYAIYLFFSRRREPETSAPTRSETGS